MIALDTNILVRYLVRDEEEQYQRVVQLIEQTISLGEQLFIPDVVLAELVWVLARCYNQPRGRIAEVLSSLYRARHVVFGASERIARAIARFEIGHADFADYLLTEHARDSGCEVVATFDGVLLKEQGYLEP